ncbi:methionine biosynthesis protein MetW [Rickettsiales bacterium]|nr:methionine biosynthesis protein MetW [Rickettsiales bacterium]
MKLDIRKDLEIIAELIKPNEKILDVGCGEGILLEYLLRNKRVDCRGIEINQKGVNKCVEKGLSVIQGDANIDLKDYPDNFFSSVILSQTIHAMIDPENVIKNLIRISKRAIISFPNFGYWKIRKDLLFNGRMPKNKILPYDWYNSPNIHICTIKDFENFCELQKVKVLERIFINSKMKSFNPFFSANLMSFQAVFCITKL